jgi:hypothetical protein
VKTALTAVAVAIAVATGASLGLGHADAAQGAPRGVHLLVLNGTHRPGLAAQVSEMLANRGFVTLQLPRRYLADAPHTTYATQLYVDKLQPGYSRAVVQTRHLFRGHTIVRAFTKPIRILAQLADHPTLVIVLGSSFQGLR